jgi:hypothetical protein
MRDLKELCLFMLSFIPWLLFMVLPADSLGTLKFSIAVCFAASLAIGFGDLKKGMILAWGTLLFFIACILLVNVFNIVWVAENMAALANGVFAAIVWVSILIGCPFALQYARQEVPREQWDDPHLVSGGLHISLFWGVMMTISALIAAVEKMEGTPSSFNFTLSLLMIGIGAGYTTLFKRKKRIEREQRAVAELASAGLGDQRES